MKIIILLLLLSQMPSDYIEPTPYDWWRWWEQQPEIVIPSQEPDSAETLYILQDSAIRLEMYPIESWKMRNFTIVDADTIWVEKANVIILQTDSVEILRERTIYERVK